MKSHHYLGGLALIVLVICSCSPGERVSKRRTSTASPSVLRMDSFPASALSGPDVKVATRRVWIYTPPSYAQHPDRRYPVLYLFDGQNLFDDTTSFVGEWRVDETLDSMRLDLIVVGLDHGGERRFREYTPYVFDKDEKKTETGLGQLTFDWLLQSVKPHIEARYRTDGRDYIGGASLGGLMALYGQLSYPGVFDGALDFSPAYWVNDPQIYQRAGRAPAGVRIYQLAGYREGSKPDWGSVVRDAQRMADSLRAAGLSDAQQVLVVDSLGEHNEAFWRRRFAEGVQWLLTPAAVPDPKK